MPRKYIAVIGMLLVVAFGIGLYFSIGNTVMITANSPASSTAAVHQPQKATCDGPASITPEDLYASRSVNFVDANGNAGTSGDACTASGEVNKTYCYENPIASGNFIPGQVAYSCPFGCSRGACNRPQASSTYSIPYPLTWTEGSIEFDLTDAYWGAVTATPDMIDGQGNPYPASSTVNALVFSFKILNNGSGTVPVPVDIVRLADEQGDLEQPATRKFIFPVTGNGDLGPQRAEEQKVVFVVPENQQSFVFTTGGSSNVFFSADIQGDWTIQVQKEPTSENG